MYIVNTIFNEPEKGVIIMWWGTVGNGCGMPFGMLVMPLFFLIVVGILFYSFNRRINVFENHQFGNTSGRDEILNELREIKEEIRELKKEKE